MALTLARMGGIPAQNEPDYNPFAEGELRRKAKQDLAKAKVDQQQAVVDLAKSRLTQSEFERTMGEDAKRREVLGNFVRGRELAQDIPIGIRAPEYIEKRPDSAPFGPIEAPKPRNPMESRAILDLAAINPDFAEAFRKGEMGERQALEDRTRKINFEDQDRIIEADKIRYGRDKDASDAAFRARQQAEVERNSRAGNNVAWYNAQTSRSNAGKAAAGKPIPASAQAGILSNIQNARKAQKALALLSGKDVGSAKGSTSPTGKFKGALGSWLSGSILNDFDPKGVDTRAAIADLGSMVIHDRSGAAVTASETPRLMPFIPTPFDSPEAAKKKIKRFMQEYNSIIEDQAQQYGPDAGYAESPLLRDYLQNAPQGIFDNAKEARESGLPPGTIVIVDGEEVEID